MQINGRRMENQLMTSIKMKILVTTDFTANSKGANRFALTLAKQTENVEVIFYHAIFTMQPTRWSDDFFKAYKNEEMERLSSDLKKFVYASIGKHKSKFANIKFVVDNCVTTEKDIISYAEKIKG